MYLYIHIKQLFISLYVMQRKEENTPRGDKKNDLLDVNVISDINIHLSEKKS